MGFLKNTSGPLGKFGLGGLLGLAMPKPPTPTAPTPPPQAPNLASALSALAQMRAPPLLGGTLLGNQTSSPISSTGGKSLLGQ